jgi:tetratricopeptide (TPR) repeat protein
MPQHLKVMISSTARDLPEHRKRAMDACMRLGMFYPYMMEHLTATDANAMEVSLKMVDKADLYLGIFGFRYGYVPPGETISVTEMEYKCAVEREIPRLIFLMSDEHQVKPADVETGDGAEGLKRLKEKLKTERVVGFFNSADDLGGQIIQALVPYREPDLTTFHYVSDIPAAPEAYIAHPYTLLQTHRLVGRQKELNLLTDWVTKREQDLHCKRILNVVAIGGMGKSALTWKWFNEIAPQEMKPLAGRMWWSFYESDATFENFITRALAYVTGRPLDEVQKPPIGEREAQLLGVLNRRPFLIVLDGLERILIAYARMDAAHLTDDDYDKQTANYVVSAYGLPASAAQSLTGEHRLRRTADPRTASFLRKLAQVQAARILVSTRLYPFDLQMLNGDPMPGCAAIFLPGLADDDALDLWRAFGVSGSRDLLLPLFRRFENHPLLIQALASEVSRYRPSPGNFEDWRRDYPDFDPFRLPLPNVQSHVLEFSLRGLDQRPRSVLQTIAGFRMPARYDALTALLVGKSKSKSKRKPCAEERELDMALTELEDRGLVGWDRRANRYDLHPIVRGVVWSKLGEHTRRGVYTALHTHFDSLPKIEDWEKVNSIEDLTPAIELYNILIGLGRYDDAIDLFYERITNATLYRLSASRQGAELLEMLFPEGMDQSPRLTKPGDQGFALNALAQAYQFSGQPGRSVPLFRAANMVSSEVKRNDNLVAGLNNLSDALWSLGQVYESESAARRALTLGREQSRSVGESGSLYGLGRRLAGRGEAVNSGAALRRSVRIRARFGQYHGAVLSSLAERGLWFGEYANARDLANRAWELETKYRAHERGFIVAARLQGAAMLALNEFAKADERLHHALTRGRVVNYVDEELAALIALAELRRRQGDRKAAREMLDGVWGPAERGPFPLLHADAYNVLAQIERDEGNHSAAIGAAAKAYGLAWCDGPPFAYHWGLVAAQKHLQELGAPEPPMPPFDESKFEPMPEVEIDPQDEFHEEAPPQPGSN